MYKATLEHFVFSPFEKHTRGKLLSINASGATLSEDFPFLTKYQQFLFEQTKSSAQWEK